MTKKEEGERADLKRDLREQIDKQAAVLQNTRKAHNEHVAAQKRFTELQELYRSLE